MQLSTLPFPFDAARPWPYTPALSRTLDAAITRVSHPSVARRRQHNNTTTATPPVRGTHHRPGSASFATGSDRRLHYWILIQTDAATTPGYRGARRLSPLECQHFLSISQHPRRLPCVLVLKSVLLILENPGCTVPISRAGPRTAALRALPSIHCKIAFIWSQLSGKCVHTAISQLPCSFLAAPLPTLPASLLHISRALSRYCLART